MLGKPIQMPAGRDKWLIRVLTMKGSHQLSEGLSQKNKDTLPKKKHAKCKLVAPVTPFFSLIFFVCLFDWVGFFSFPSGTINFNNYHLQLPGLNHLIAQGRQLKYSAVDK